MSDALLTVEELSLAFGGTQVLDDISFSIDSGETLGIIGPNGAGKTALLNCITGAYRAPTGRIRFRGDDIATTKEHRRARLGLVRTFQHPELLIDEMTVEDSVLLGRHNFIRSSFCATILRTRRARASERRARDRVSALLEFMGLSDFLESRIVDLPYGTQKLVELTRALAMEPRLLIVDEPAAGMLPQEKRVLGEHLRRIRNETGMSLGIIEHDIELVTSLCDRVLVLVAGHKLAEGPPREVLGQAAVRTAYLGVDAGRTG